jgi:hypothetical protein
VNRTPVAICTYVGKVDLEGKSKIISVLSHIRLIAAENPTPIEKFPLGAANEERYVANG